MYSTVVIGLLVLNLSILPSPSLGRALGEHAGVTESTGEPFIIGTTLHFGLNVLKDTSVSKFLSHNMYSLVIMHA